MGNATTVLVLEDDDSIRQLLAATLRAEGHQVEEATTVRDGRTLASNRPIDVFLVDLGLPDGDGLEFIRWLRGWTQRPVIVLSARLHEAHKVAALDAGADDFVSKPFSVAELHARLRVALRHAHKAGAERLAREVLALYTCGPAGGGGVRTTLRPTLGTVSCLMPRALVQPRFEMLDAGVAA